jgi:hypothetical protein
MQIEDFIFEATERVLGWGLSDDVLSQAIGAQAALMANLSPEQHHFNISTVVLPLQ